MICQSSQRVIVSLFSLVNFGQRMYRKLGTLRTLMERECMSYAVNGTLAVKFSGIDYAKTTINKTQFRLLGFLGMDGDVCGGLFLIVIISLATGVPCLYYGTKCKTAELRAEHKTGLCKNIRNDDSAIALRVFGWISSIPWLMALGWCLSKLCGITYAVGVELFWKLILNLST